MQSNHEIKMDLTDTSSEMNQAISINFDWTKYYIMLCMPAIDRSEDY